MVCQWNDSIAKYGSERVLLDLIGITLRHVVGAENMFKVLGN